MTVHALARERRKPGPARDAERDAVVARMYGQGASLRAVARAVNLSHEGVRASLRSQGVELRGRGRPRNG